MSESIHAQAKYIARRTKKGDGYTMLRVQGGQTLAQYFVPLVNHETHDVDVKGEAFEIIDGKFNKLAGEELETVLFFARRGITGGV
jgi:hypothetical protein